MPKYNINNLLAYAIENEGKLISKKYKNTTEKYEWICKKEHVFTMSWESCLRYKSWCKLCRYNVGMNVMIEYAKKKGGKCLSEEYKHIDSTYQWECSAGHIFDRTFISIRDNDHWCNKCIKNDKLESLTMFVKEKYGENNMCISDKYRDNDTIYKWMCNKNHIIFEMTWNAVMKGYWCHHCRFNTGIDELQKFAISKGGKLVSTEYNRILDDYKWMCGNGHVFDRNWQNVRRDDYWCTQCDKDKIFTEMKQYAIDNGGELLTENYTQSSDMYKWKCRYGHIWTRPWSAMKHAKSWCRRCNCWELEDIKAVAESRNEKCIECISGKGISGRYIWMCIKGHIFEVCGSIVYESKCAQCNKLSIEEMKQIAIDRGGECISDTYINSRTSLTWKCCRGHIWNAVPKSIKSHGTWCQLCFKENKIKSNSNCRDDVDANKCPKGHILIIPFGKTKIDNNDWCRLCHLLKTRYNNALKAIERCKNYLTNFNGELLSSEEEILKQCEIKTFLSCSIKVKCKNNHEWETSLTSLGRGRWCTKCRYKSETMAIEIIEEIMSEKFIKIRPKWLQKLELDGYCEKLKLAIEYNGIQHTIFSHFFHHKSIKNFETQKARDLLKRELCKKHGVTLITVPFQYNMKNRNSMYDFIRSELIRNNVMCPVPIIFED